MCVCIYRAPLQQQVIFSLSRYSGNARSTIIARYTIILESNYYRGSSADIIVDQRDGYNGGHAVCDGVAQYLVDRQGYIHYSYMQLTRIRQAIYTYTVNCITLLTPERPDMLMIPTMSVQMRR